MSKRKAGASKRSVGRPTAYDPETHLERAMNYALLGMSDVEIAAAFNIDGATLYRWQNRYPEFRESITAGKAEADASAQTHSKGSPYPNFVMPGLVPGIHGNPHQRSLRPW